MGTRKERSGEMSILLRPKTPRYFDIIDYILKEIEEGHLSEGDLIPSEKELDEMFSVSRTTTRRAMNELVSQGYLLRMQGKGTYVHRQVYSGHYPMLSSFSENMRAPARLAEHHTVNCLIEEPTPQVCRELEIDCSTPCLHFNRLLSIDAQPVGYAEIWIPKFLVKDYLSLFTPEILDPHSIYYLLEGKEIGMTISRAIEVATAENADQELAEILKIKTGTAMLVIRHVGYLSDGMPCDSLKLVFGGSHYHYRTELIRPAGAGWAGRVFVVDDKTDA